MNKRKSFPGLSSRGMTLVEVLIAVAIFALIMGAVAAFQANVFSYSRSISSSLQTAQDAQIILKTMLREIRSMAPSANGAYPLVNAATSTITFFADANVNGTAEQVTYTLKGNYIYRSVIQPVGTPPAYTGANQSTSTLVTNVRNSTSTPVFQYFDTNYTGTSSPLAYPIPVTTVRLIKINLTLDVDPNRSPVPITYSTQVSLRNVKSNL